MTETDEATRYREVARLGVGGMAKVALAEDTVLGRSVALKRIHATGDPQGMLRLKREAMVGASLNHPNLVAVYDVKTEDDDDVVIVMEYVQGQTLADVIQSRGPLPAEQALPILKGVAAALDAIHARGIVHRDVKPANVLLGIEGAVKLADLGIADVADRTRITTSGAVLGTFSYMAPEQLEGASPKPAMDIYALAAVAYEMLSGEKARPESNPLALAHAIATQPPADLRQARPDTSPASASVLQRGMSKDPANRPATAGELVGRLQAALAPPEPTHPEPRVEPPARTRGPAAEPAAPEPQRVRPRTVSAKREGVQKPPAARTKRPPQPQPASRERSTSRLIPVLALIAAAAVAGVVVAVLSTGGSGKSHGAASASASSRTTKKSTSATKSSAGTKSGAAAGGSSETSTSTASGSSAPASPGTASGGSVGASASSATGALKGFYEDAAAHQYAAAWGLADQNMRNLVGGYASFQNTMSAVRSITFQRDQVLNSNADSATVGLQTTSVQTDRTQHCSGTARAVRSGGAWLVDGISIHC
ncbi:MAG: protein kinase [Solirubrobacteraceae bacterium]